MKNLLIGFFVLIAICANAQKIFTTDGLKLAIDNTGKIVTHLYR